MNQKGFVNIALIGLVVILAIAAGYFVLVKKPAAPTTTESETSGLPVTQQTVPPSTDNNISSPQPGTANGVGGGITDNPEGYLNLDLPQTLPSPSVRERVGFLEISFPQTCGSYYRIYAKPTISGDDKYSLIGEIITNSNSQNCTTSFRHTDPSRSPFNKTNTQQYIYTTVDAGKNKEMSRPSQAISLPTFPSVDMVGFKPTPEQCSVFSIPKDVIQKRASNEKIDLYRIVNGEEISVGSTNFVQPIQTVFRDNAYAGSRLREMNTPAVQGEFLSSPSTKSIHNLDQNNFLNFLVFTDQQMIFYHTQPILPAKIFTFTVDTEYHEVLEAAMISGLFNWGCG